ncbi:MAG TPA: ABC transporter permease [Candidatus Limnocylindrales bacterium]
MSAPTPAPVDRPPVGRTAGSGGVGNAVLVARREYIERVRSRAFLFSTVLLAGLAIVVSLIPLGVRLVDRATVTRVVVVAPDPALAQRAISTMDTFLNTNGATADKGTPTFTFERLDDAGAARALVRDGAVAGAMLIDRGSDGGLDFTVLSVGGLSPDRAQLLQVGAFAVGILDWTASQPPSTSPFVIPGFEVSDPNIAVGGGDATGGGTIDAAEYASRRIVGIVFVVLSFLTLVFYGLWVASGVVAEKAGRVMELLISAATAPQLVVGKIVGIGLAGLTQVSLVLLPALAALFASGAIGDQVLGPDANAGTSLAGLSPGLLAAFLVYFVLGFALYAALYAGAGSLLSRAEDLQIVALPLSIPAIMGYFPAVLALSGGASGFIRVASYVPLWSPFVMLARLSIGRVEPWEVALSLGLLAVTVPLVTLLAIRVYRAGVLLYGQPPTIRTFLRAVRG